MVSDVFFQIHIPYLNFSNSISRLYKKVTENATFFIF
nr:MAG TPA: hypothetical protein [Bacteriophage sp.]DAU53534.1 MAG TPA: hypothetical protein [Caudoviricetes sp.]